MSEKFITLYNNHYEYIGTDMIISQYPFSSNVDTLVCNNGQLSSGRIYIGEYSIDNVTGYVYNIYVSVDILGNNTLTVKENNRICFKYDIHQSTLQRFKVKIPLMHNVIDTTYTVEVSNSSKYDKCKIKIIGC